LRARVRGVIGTEKMKHSCPACDVLVEQSKFMGVIVHDPQSIICSNCGAKLVLNKTSPSVKGDIFFRLVMLLFLISQVYFLFVVGSTRLSLSVASGTFFFMAIYKAISDRNKYKWIEG